MGDNFAAAGFASAQEFVLAMTRSEEAQLQAFVRFVSSRGSMAEALRKKDWATFAVAYNGPGYQKNRYDARLGEAYERFAGASAPAATPLDARPLP
jgi:N-acetylmuramidase